MEEFPLYFFAKQPNLIIIITGTRNSSSRTSSQIEMQSVVSKINSRPDQEAELVSSNQKGPSFYLYRFSHSILKKFYVNIKYLRIYPMYGQIITGSNSSLLIDMMCSTKMTQKIFIEYLLKSGAENPQISYRMNGGKKENKNLREKIDKITEYFEKNANLQRLEYQRKRLRLMGSDFLTYLFHACVIEIFGNQYEEDKQYLQHLDQKFEDLLDGTLISQLTKNFSGQLDMTELYGDYAKYLRSKYEEYVNMVSNEKRQTYRKIRSEQEKLVFRYTNYNKQKFIIRQSYTAKNLSKQNKQILLIEMLHFFKIFFLTKKQKPLQLDENFVPQQQENARQAIESLEIQAQRSRQYQEYQNDLMEEEKQNIQIQKMDEQFSHQNIQSKLDELQFQPHYINKEQIYIMQVQQQIGKYQKKPLLQELFLELSIPQLSAKVNQIQVLEEQDCQFELLDEKKPETFNYLFQRDLQYSTYNQSIFKELPHFD